MWRAVLIGIALLAVVGALHLTYYLVRVGGIRTEAYRDAAARLVSAEDRIEADLADVASDLAFLGNHLALRQYLEDGTAERARAIVDDYIAMARAKQKYDQIRLIGADGREIVRVNGNQGEPYATAPEDLQAKNRRYYLAKALALREGEYYVSPFDLNVEHDRIETPIKPMIRFALPVFDRQGTRRGAVILNYLGQRVLDRLKDLETKSGADVWLLNPDGYWLAGPEPADEWAFMYPDRASRSFATAYPEVWRSVLSAYWGVKRSGNDAFVYRRVAFYRSTQGVDAAAPLNWTLVAHIPEQAIAAAARPLGQGVLTAFGASSLVSAVAALLVAQSIGIRRETRKLRERAETSLRKSEAGLRVLLDSMPDGVVVVDESGIIKRLNARAGSLFGYDIEALLDKPIEILLPERLRNTHVAHRKLYFDQPRVRNMGEGLSLAGMRADGSEFPIAVSLSPVEADEGSRVIASVRDITAQREAETRIRDLNEQLVRDNNSLAVVNQELEAFSASVSHDLRSPLRAIDGFSKALLEDYPERLDETGRFYLDRIRNGAQNMGLLIDDLLKLSRITRLDLNEQEVDVTKLARSVADALAESEPERRVTFEIDEGMLARADRRLLLVALENLLGNAYKFTAGRADAQIRVGVEETDGQSVFYVRDNGAGFDMTYADMLFSAFKRLHDAREFPGTGVGLATVQRIIHKHGGRIWADAEVGKGATFHFTLRDERLS